MRSPIANTKQRPHITVWLDESDERNLKEFHCSICGKVVFEYYGRLDKLLPGKAYQEDDADFDNADSVHMCRGSVERHTGTGPRFERCGAKYWICR